MLYANLQSVTIQPAHNEQGAVTELIKYCISVTSSIEVFYVNLKL